MGAQSLQLDVDSWAELDVVDAGDADIVPAWLDRGHAMIFVAMEAMRALAVHKRAGEPVRFELS